MGNVLFGIYKWFKKYLWDWPGKYFTDGKYVRGIGKIYIFVGFWFAAYLLIHNRFWPEWISRLSLICFFYLAVTPWVLWMGLSPTSKVVTKRVLDMGGVGRWVLEVCVRLMFIAMALGLIYSAVPLGKDILDIAKNGDKCLVRRTATIADAHSGQMNSIYRSIWFAGEPESHDYFFSMSGGYGLWENTVWNFVLLKNSGLILEIHKP